jgi:proliferating cell nuclear antigen
MPPATSAASTRAVALLMASSEEDSVACNRMELRTVQAGAFKMLVEALKELITDTVMEFDATGMRIAAMDNSRVVLVHLKLDASKFEMYHCEGKLSVGINMLCMHKVLKTVSANDVLAIFMDRTDPNHLYLRLTNTTKSSRTTYKLNLLDLDHPSIHVEPIDFTGVVTMPSVEFQKICRDMQPLAEFVEIKSVRNQLIFSCRGDFCMQETVVVDNTGENDVTGLAIAASKAVADLELSGAAPASAAGLDAYVTSPREAPSDTDSAVSDAPESPPAPAPERANEIVQGIFGIKHLVLFTKCTHLSPTLELYLKNNFPLILQYSVASLGNIRLALAPQKASGARAGAAEATAA